MIRNNMFIRGEKKGQVTIFVIVALVIIGVLIIILLYPRLAPILTGQEFSPGNFLKSCVSPSIKTNIENLSIHGGDFNPEGFILYQDEKIKYLCYTSQYYQTCTNQMPLVKGHFESELGKALNKKTRECVDSLKQEYERRGYSVSMGTLNTGVSINPKQISIEFAVPTTVTKEESRTYKNFTIDYESQMYDVLMISESIIEFESTLGDINIEDYLQYYPDLKIEKIRLSDGSKVYRVENVVSKEVFSFATRSLAWPAGYGLV